MRQLISSSASIYILLLITLLSSGASASSFEANSRPAPHEAVVKRALNSANSFKINWHINGKRASLTSHIVAKSYIAKSGAIKQSHLNTCGNACDVTTGCTFSQVIQLSKDSLGTVMCALHSSVIPSSKVTIKSGPSGSSTVITSYGIQRNVPKQKTPAKKTTSSSKKTTSTKKKSKKTTTTKKNSKSTTSKKNSKSTSTHHVTTSKKSTGKSAKTTSIVSSKTSTTKKVTSTTKTSTSATATATANVTAPYFPPSPPGAYFVQFNSCPGMAATVPAFVNNQFNYSTSTSAYIVQHGSARNFNDYFSTVYNVIGNNSLIFAPNNYMTSDPQWPTTWYQPKLNFAWGSTWTSGGDAIAPFRGTTNALNGGKCSTLDTFDAALKMLDDRSRFPYLTNVYFVSHSGGANLVSKYSQFYNGNHNFAIRYIIANPANQAYFTTSRPYNLTLAAENANNNGSNGTNPSDTPSWEQNNTTTSSPPTPITTLTDSLTTSTVNSSITTTSTSTSGVSDTTTLTSTSSISSTGSGVSSTTTTTISASTHTTTSFPVVTETITTSATDASGNTVATTITSTITESLSTTTTGTRTDTSTSATSSPTSIRRRDNPDAASCSGYNQYPYQLDQSTMNRYVASRFDSIQGVFNRWIQRDVVLLVGDYDTDARYSGGGQDCTNQAQGGPNRRDRAYGWWAYQNILAGTGADVSSYFGYQELIATGAQQIYNGVFAHQICVVDGVGHDQNGMFASQCGVAAMTQAITGVGAGPQYP